MITGLLKRLATIRSCQPAAATAARTSNRGKGFAPGSPSTASTSLRQQLPCRPRSPPASSAGGLSGRGLLAGPHSRASGLRDLGVLLHRWLTLADILALAGTSGLAASWWSEPGSGPRLILPGGKSWGRTWLATA